MEKIIFSVDTIKGNCVYERNGTGDSTQYTKEELIKLFQGFEIPVKYDENGYPIEYEALSEYEEYTEEYLQECIEKFAQE